MAEIPNLAGYATAELVEQIGSSNFKASYINWSRTLQMLRNYAPGWMPESVMASNGSLVHEAPVGGYLLIQFRHVDGSVTPAVPQAIMDTRNAAIQMSKITARDITDTHRRGICMAAALTFGLAYELWAKMPLESGYRQEEMQPEDVLQEQEYTGKPMDGAWENCDSSTRSKLELIASNIGEYAEMEDYKGAHEFIHGLILSSEDKIRLWSLLPSKTRAALKREQANAEA